MNIFIWLSSADSETLNDCPKWEKRKYEALGMAVLVPVIFGAIASCYAVSTLTDCKPVIFGFPVIWAFIIMAIDRILLSTYRAFAPKGKKFIQFSVRFFIALLMGATISHPLTLLVFKDAITAEIESNRQVQVDALISGLDERKQKLNISIEKTSLLLKDQQAEYNKVNAQSYVRQTVSIPEPSIDLDKEIENAKTKRDIEIKRLETVKDQYNLEVSGKNGKAGVGPAARRLLSEILVIQSNVDNLSKIENDLQKQKIDMIEERLKTEKQASEQAAKSDQQNLAIFNKEKAERVNQLKAQIDNTSKELERLRGEAAQLSGYADNKVAAVETRRMGDMLQRTLALHSLFHKEGGTFALIVYTIITLLFSTIDTVPLVAKFFSSPGIYDERVRKAEEEEGAINPIAVEIIDVTKPIRDRVSLK